MSRRTNQVERAAVDGAIQKPDTEGFWLLNGPIDRGALDLVRPARHMPCKLPFAVWMALAKAVPVSLDGESTQRELAEAVAEGEAAADAAIEVELLKPQPANDT